MSKLNNISRQSIGIRGRREFISRVRCKMPKADMFLLIFDDGRRIASLSAGWNRKAGASFPSSIGDITSQIDLAKAYPKVFQKRLGQYILIYASIKPLSEGVLEVIGHLCNSYLFNSLSHYNRLEDRVLSRLKDLNLQGAAPETQSYDQLTNILEEKYSVSAIVYRLLDDEVVLEFGRVEAAEVHPPIGDMHAEIREAVSNGRVIECSTEEPRFLRSYSGCENLNNQSVYIFPIRSTTRDEIRTNDFLLISKKNWVPASLSTLIAIDQCVQEYVYTKTKTSQRECLFWQTQKMTGLLEFLADKDQKDEDTFRDYLGDLGGYIVNSTQAHSFAYLSYDATAGALVREIYVSDPHDRFLPDVLREKNISLRQSQHYISAALFSGYGPRKKNYIYIRNIHSPVERVEFGLLGVECGRNREIAALDLPAAQTVSEMALLIEDQGIPIGVLCVECPHRNGLDGDELFLRQVAYNISNYWSALHRISDQLWLRRNLELQDVSHQLVKVVESMPDNVFKDRLLQISRDIRPSNSSQSIRSLEDRLDRLVLAEAGQSRLLADQDVRPLIRKFFDPSTSVSDGAAAAAFSIVSNLLRNRTHTSSPHPISLTTRPSYRGIDSAIVIRTTLEYSGPEIEIGNAFRRPIVRTDREHLGLYLIGVIARTWGGRISFDRRPGAIKRLLEITLPSGSTNEVE